MAGASPPIRPEMSPARIETLADGVFAIAMTLLAFDVTVPDVPAAEAAALLPGELEKLLPRFAVYAISFVVLGVYWVAHHAQFRVISNADRPLLWINILFLLLVAFVPFSTSLMSRYPLAPIAVQVYGLVLIWIGGAGYLHWWYATSGRRLVPLGTSDAVIAAAKRRIAVAPAVCGSPSPCPSSTRLRASCCTPPSSRSTSLRRASTGTCFHAAAEL